MEKRAEEETTYGYTRKMKGGFSEQSEKWAIGWRILHSGDNEREGHFNEWGDRD